MLLVYHECHDWLYLEGFFAKTVWIYWATHLSFFSNQGHSMLNCNPCCHFKGNDLRSILPVSYLFDSLPKVSSVCWCSCWSSSGSLLLILSSISATCFKKVYYFLKELNNWKLEEPILKIKWNKKEKEKEKRNEEGRVVSSISYIVSSVGI